MTYPIIFLVLWLFGLSGFCDEFKTGICDPSLVGCNKRGMCRDLEKNGHYVCICDDSYIGEYCEIEQRSRLTAFLLELCLGYFFGAGNFYLGRILPGVIKISLTLIMAVLIFYRPTNQLKTPDIERRRIMFIISMILINMTLFIWWILDMIYIGGGYYNDGWGHWVYDDFTIRNKPY